MTNITRIVNSTVVFIDQLRNGSDGALNGSAISFENILSSLFPITFSCYHSAFEYADIGIVFGETLIDGLQLLYNMIHKLGNIYDCIYFLVKHHKNHPFGSDDEEGEEGDPEDAVEEKEIDLEAMSDEERAEYELEFEAYNARKEEWWFKLGIYYGTLLNLLLYVPADWVDYDPTLDVANVVNLI